MPSKFSEYRLMWVVVFFDLPTLTKTHRKKAARFRKDLMKDGFTMYQYSIYVRHCPSAQNAQTHVDRVQSIVPTEGHVCIFTITDRQFADIKVFNGSVSVKPDYPIQQLELF